jgi:hypothetical protein
MALAWEMLVEERAQRIERGLIPPGGMDATLQHGQRPLPLSRRRRPESAGGVHIFANRQASYVPAKYSMFSLSCALRSQDYRTP